MSSPIEAIGFATGLLSVWLAQRLHVATWPASLVSVACFAFLFYDARLYAAATLQLGIAVLGLYGWRRWAHARREQGVNVTMATTRELAAGIALAAAATTGGAWLLATRTDSPLPWPDAAVLALSLLAIWQQARGRLQCWWTWIAVDLVSIPLYASRGLPLTALLYVLFLLLCIAGWRRWRRRMLAAAEQQRSKDVQGTGA